MINLPLSPLTIAVYGALLGAIIALWIRSRFLWIGLFGVSVVLGCVAGILTGTALLALGLFAAACVYFQKQTSRESTSAWLRAGLTVILSLLVLPFVLHLVPGFHNPTLAKRVVLSAHSTPYTLYLNFDKTAVGLLLVAFVCRPSMLTLGTIASGFRRTGWIMTLNIAVAFVLSWILGYVAWEPKGTSFFFAWALVNLCFVCLSEEAFFRGLIQTQLTSCFQGRRYGSGVALGISSLLFGLAHVAGGPSYVILATIAGLGYGMVYQRSGRLEFSIAAHFLLNAIHFLLFTYPALAPNS